MLKLFEKCINFGMLQLVQLVIVQELYVLFLLLFYISLFAMHDYNEHFARRKSFHFYLKISTI